MPTVFLYEQFDNRRSQLVIGYALAQRHSAGLRLITTNYGKRGRPLTLKQFPITAEFLHP